MALEPAKLTTDLIDDYNSYLRSRFFFKDHRLREHFSSLLADERRLHVGPFLELTPAFKEGDTVRALVTRGVLDKALLNVPDKALHADRALYLHQQLAIEKIHSGRNVIVATGTGSGKTETYFLPIVSHLLAELTSTRESKPGVRALLVYPMNTLANDQLKRIRHLLCQCPEITFGRYIGETPTNREHGLSRFHETWPRKPVIPNELKSREQMWDSPPHILITNFAMLEYLLVRPQDSVFFDPGAAELMRFLVLDEVHTYDGAKGTEIAMLLRRLKQRMGFNLRGRIRCVGTSATLGGGRDLPDIAEFADKLFDEPFEFHPNGEPRDIVEAKRVVYQKPQRLWGPISPRFYRELARLTTGTGSVDTEGFRKLLEAEPAIPTDVRKVALERIDEGVRNPNERTEVESHAEQDEWHLGDSVTAAVQAGKRTDPMVFSGALYEILRGDNRLSHLQELCTDSPKQLSEIQGVIFSEDDIPRELYEALLGLVATASKAASAPDESPLIRARYHLFFRALEGGFLCLEDHKSSGPKLYLERRKSCVEHPDSRVFEVGVCRRCGEAILVGSLATDPRSGRHELTSEDPTQEMLLDDDRPRRIFVTLTASVNRELNEDELVQDNHDGDADTRFVRVRLCRRCGVLGEADGEWERGCGDKAETNDVFRVPSRGRDIELCPSCGSRSLQRDILQTLYTGPDEPVAELATTIFQSSNDSYVRDDGEKRKLLTFSDSRQDAAYFAPYLETLYRTTLRRHVILSLVERETDPLPLEDLAARVVRYLEDKQWLGETATRDTITTKSWRWVIGEVLHASKDRRSLEELGLVDFALRRFFHPSGDGAADEFVEAAEWALARRVNIGTQVATDPPVWFLLLQIWSEWCP